MADLYTQLDSANTKLARAEQVSTAVVVAVRQTPANPAHHARDPTRITSMRSQRAPCASVSALSPQNSHFSLSEEHCTRRKAGICPMQGEPLAISLCSPLTHLLTHSRAPAFRRRPTERCARSCRATACATPLRSPYPVRRRR